MTATTSPGAAPPRVTGARPSSAPGAALGRDPLEWVLTGGEDHALAATFPGLSGPPPGWTVVGRVLGPEHLAEPGGGVRVDGAPRAGAGGWRHFGR